jgi:hypothetical protein
MNVNKTFKCVSIAPDLWLVVIHNINAYYYIKLSKSDSIKREKEEDAKDPKKPLHL